MKYLLSILALSAALFATGETKQDLCERLTVCYMEVAEQNQETPTVELASKARHCAEVRAKMSCNRMIKYDK